MTTMIAAVAGACLSLVLALAAPTAMSHPELKAAYCPNNDTDWGRNTPDWKQCLLEPCFHNSNDTTNNKCAPKCAPLWQANNACLQDDCSYALAGGDPRVCPITRYITWAGGHVPDSDAVKTCRNFAQQRMCSLYTCAIQSVGPGAGCWVPENS